MDFIIPVVFATLVHLGEPLPHLMCREVCMCVYVCLCSERGGGGACTFREKKLLSEGKKLFEQRSILEKNPYSIR